MRHPTILLSVLVIAAAIAAAGAVARHRRDVGRADALRTGLSIAAAVLLVAATMIAFYRWTWHDLATFSLFIDRCPTLFCDFDNHFYPQGKAILSSDAPVRGFFYPAPFALLLAPIGSLPRISALELWGVLTAVATAALFTVPFVWAPGVFGGTWRRAALYTFAFASCAPVLHNFKWGQVSVPLTLLVLLSLWLAERRSRTAAGIVLGVGIATKYYPGIFLLYFLVRRDWRTVSSAIAMVAALFILTAAVLGVEPTVRFQLLVNRAIQAEQRWIAMDANSQYVAYLALRRISGAVDIGMLGLATCLGYLVCAINVGLLWIAQHRWKPGTSYWAAVLVFTATPFWIPTSWPHYFVYLPALQMFAVHDLSTQTGPTITRSLQWGLVTASIALASSMALVYAAGSWMDYSSAGYLFASNACLLVYAYVRLIPEGVRAVRDFRHQLVHAAAGTA